MMCIEHVDQIFGLNLASLSRADLRIRPKTATITEDEIEAILARRKDARAAKDFAASDALRDELVAAGVEVMAGDPLGWDWRLETQTDSFPFVSSEVETTGSSAPPMAISTPPHATGQGRAK